MKPTLVNEIDPTANLPTVVTVPDKLSMAKEPELVLADAQRAAQALLSVISSKKKPVMFNGEQYLENEDWQTVASFYGVVTSIQKTETVEMAGEYGFKATAQAIRAADGTVLSQADAYCLTDEENWKDKPLFQLCSMAETRASSKVLRQIFSRIVVLAGCRPTPAEEMTNGLNKTIPCPECGHPLIKSKGEFGGGYFCWKKKGGCGRKFTDEEIEKAGASCEVPGVSDTSVLSTQHSVPEKPEEKISRLMLELKNISHHVALTPEEHEYLFKFCQAKSPTYAQVEAKLSQVKKKIADYEREQKKLAKEVGI